MFRSEKERILARIAQDVGYVTPGLASRVYASEKARRAALEHLVREGYLELDGFGTRFVWTGKEVE